mmetsp:Transcript_99953/g.311420  ORF Transcript_99953/g.311420 Transcript_99953/m.311420 type:complete len:97 (+) Transcript_99953:681-971(+)
MAPKVPSVGEGTTKGGERRTPRAPETSRLVSSVAAKTPKTKTQAPGEPANALETGACADANGKNVNNNAIKKTSVSLKNGSNVSSISSVGNTSKNT